MSNNKAPANAIKSKKKINLNTQFIAGLVALALILLFNLIYEPNFFRISIVEGRLYGSIIDVINRCVPTMIISMGMTLVIATGGVDISVGAVAAISGALAVSLIGYNFDSVTGETTTNMNMYLAILIALIVCTACGAWNGLLVSRLGIQPMVATLILMTAGRGIAQLITGGQIPRVYTEDFTFISQGSILAIPTGIYIALAVVLIVYAFTKLTAFGMLCESVGINASASRYSGINAKNIKLICYTICGLCAGIAGIHIASTVQGADANNAGLNIEMDAILAVVLGGTSMAGGKFYIWGTAVGALIIQALTTTIYSLGVPPEIIYVVKSIVVVIVVMLQSNLIKNLFKKIGSKRKKSSAAASV